MRIWTLHPRYLDVKGLVAAWREGLLAQKVLAGATAGYARHPQLARFKASAAPLDSIACYLRAVLAESLRRSYSFDASKIGASGAASAGAIATTRGQLEYEARLLLSKLATRDARAQRVLAAETRLEANPAFSIVEGGIEAWEKVIPGLG
jgi:hypothetical protein